MNISGLGNVGGQLKEMTSLLSIYLPVVFNYMPCKLFSNSKLKKISSISARECVAYFGEVIMTLS